MIHSLVLWFHVARTGNANLRGVVPCHHWWYKLLQCLLAQYEHKYRWFPIVHFHLNCRDNQTKDNFNQQSIGIAMGPPVSVTVANLVMDNVEQRALSMYPQPPPFWKWYVDDTCTALPPNEVHSFHAHLNTIELSIQFTYEVEENGFLPFLNTKITHRTDASLSTKVYRNPYHTDK